MHLAARSARLLGIIATLFGLLVLLGAAMTYQSSHANSSMVLAVQLGSGGVYLAFGVAFLVFGRAIRNRRLWAIYSTMALSGLALGISAIGLVRTLLAVINAYGQSHFIYLILLLQVAWLAAFAQLMYHLAQSYQAIKADPDHTRGFEPLMAAKPVQAISVEPPTE